MANLLTFIREHQGLLTRFLLSFCVLVFVMYLSLYPVSNNEEIFHPMPFEVMKKKTGTLGTEEAKTNDCHIIPKKVNSCNNLPNYFLEEATRGEYQNAIINFWHVQKTGGTTVKGCLKEIYKQRNFPKPFIGMGMCGSMLKMFNNDTFLKIKSYQPLVLGHYTLGVCDLIRNEIVDRKCSAFAIFRDPYDRAVSHYFHCRARYLINSRSKSAIDLPVTDWVKKYGTVTWRSFFKAWQINRNENGITCSGSGGDHRSIGRKWPQDEFFINDIVNNLVKHLSFVGLFEDMPTTYKMLQEVYKLPFYDMCMKMHENVGSYEGFNLSARNELKRASKRALMEDEEIQRLMKFDILLYEKAKEIFEAQKKEFEAMQRLKLGG